MHIWGEESGCVSGRVRLFVGNRWSGRVGSTFRRVGSGPRKVTRGQLWFCWDVDLATILGWLEFEVNGILGLMESGVHVYTQQSLLNYRCDNKKIIFSIDDITHSKFVCVLTFKRLIVSSTSRGYHHAPMRGIIPSGIRYQSGKFFHFKQIQIPSSRE